VYHYLRQQGVPVTAAQVAQAATHSGWKRLRHTLNERYDAGNTSEFSALAKVLPKHKAELPLLLK
jgi:hypothetical protein